MLVYAQECPREANDVNFKTGILAIPAILLLLAMLTVGSASLSDAAKETATPHQPVVVDHHYAIKYGFEYAYEPALSENAKKAGQVSSALLMFKYAGQKDGQYQVYMQDGMRTLVAECPPASS